MRLIEAGDPGGRPVVFLHGWPESARTWDELISLTGNDIRAISVDLPGIGGSAADRVGGSKAAIADAVHDLVHSLGLSGVTLVGHDIGGMVAYAYLRRHRCLDRAVIMNVPIPGVAPWEEFVRQPYLWHFAFHAIDQLPEKLVRGQPRAYFDYFYDALTVDPGRIDEAARESFAAAYAEEGALTAGFDWYRAFDQDAADNRRASGGPKVSTPLLYLRGAEERGGDITGYVRGLREAGVEHVEPALVAGARHFPQHEAPATTWRLISDFMR